jgi:SWI/SNF-related matrix-associated actin-dependent regulator 1 of chromatin subfamily A
MRTARLDGTRFYCNFAKTDEVVRDFKRIEGRRWHPEIKSWSTPASLRAWRKLSSLGFQMIEFGGGKTYVGWLEAGCPVSALDDARLYPFQREGVGFLARRRRAILADQQGLGKTKQAIIWQGLDKRQGLTVVVAPKITHQGWAQEILLLVGVSPIICPSEGNMPKEGWVVLNPEQLGKFKAPPQFDLIVDEAHWYTNVKALRTKRVLSLADVADRVLLLTGTLPAQPIKLWPFLLMLKERTPQEFFGYALRYCAAMRGDFGWDFTGRSNEGELKEELRHFTLRRLKKDVLPELPDKTYKTVVATTSKTELAELSVLDKELLALARMGQPLVTGLGLAAMQKYRMECSRIKVKTTIEYAQAHGVPENKLIIFGEFLEPLHEIGEGIENTTDSKVVYLIGETSNRKAEIIETFRENPDVGVLLCTYGAGGVGANLQFASTVLVHDIPWTPDALEQAEDRIHRIGQEGKAYIVSVVTPTLSEAIMLQGLQEKKDAIQALYGA